MHTTTHLLSSSEYCALHTEATITGRARPCLNLALKLLECIAVFQIVHRCIVAVGDAERNYLHRSF